MRVFQEIEREREREREREMNRKTENCVNKKQEMTYNQRKGEGAYMITLSVSSLTSTASWERGGVLAT